MRRRSGAPRPGTHPHPTARSSAAAAARPAIRPRRTPPATTSSSARYATAAPAGAVGQLQPEPERPPGRGQLPWRAASAVAAVAWPDAGGHENLEPGRAARHRRDRYRELLGPPQQERAGQARRREIPPSAAPGVMRPGSLRLGDRLLVKETHAASFDRRPHHGNWITGDTRKRRPGGARARRRSAPRRLVDAGRTPAWWRFWLCTRFDGTDRLARPGQRAVIIRER